MPVTMLDESEVNEFFAQRDRLAPIAALCGVRFDSECSYQLLSALDVIYQERQKLTLEPSRSGAHEQGAGPLLSAARATAKSWPSTAREARSDDALGMQVVNKLRERRGLAAIKQEGGR